jgi:hypothetical protein
LSNKEKIKNYIQFSESVSKELKDYPPLPKKFADYTRNLMIEYMKLRDFETVKELFDSYIDRIIPQSGLDKSSSHIASQAIAISIILDDNSIYDRVEEHILGEDFDIEEISNEILLFNLACHYALIRDKKQLLSATEQAIKHGKKRDQFLADSDFSYYRNDQDFLLILNSGVSNE